MPVQCWGCNGFTYWRRHWGCQNPWCWYTNEDAQKEAFVAGNGKGGKTKVFAQNRPPSPPPAERPLAPPGVPVLPPPAKKMPWSEPPLSQSPPPVADDPYFVQEQADNKMLPKARKGRCFILDNQNDWALLEDDDVADKPKADKGQGSADKQDADKGQGSADKPKADKAKKKMKKKKQEGGVSKKRKGDAALRVAKR